MENPNSNTFKILIFLKDIKSILSKGEKKSILDINLTAVASQCNLRLIPSQNILMTAVDWSSEPSVKTALKVHNAVINEKKERTAASQPAQPEQKQSELQIRVNLLTDLLKRSDSKVDKLEKEIRHYKEHGLDCDKELETKYQQLMERYNEVVKERDILKEENMTLKIKLESESDVTVKQNLFVVQQYSKALESEVSFFATRVMELKAECSKAIIETPEDSQQ